MLLAAAATLGHAAGLATSCLWTGTSLFFTAAGRRIGPTTVNASRLCLAVLLLAVTHYARTGLWWPALEAWQVLFLATSGLVGLTIGDQALFTAFVLIGPRVAMLVMTTAPLIATVVGWLVLGERLSPLALVGIAVTLTGVGVVIRERRTSDAAALFHASGPSYVRGLLLAAVGATCQAVGLLLSKQGMGYGWLPHERVLNPQAATFVRMCFAALTMLPILVWHLLRQRARRRAGVVVQRPGSRLAGFGFAACGAVVGPYLGVWMSLVAAANVPLGVAQTLTSLPPVLILPLARTIHREVISPLAVVGALLAVAGVGLLFVA